MKVLIIDDEPVAQKQLQHLLFRTGRSVEVLACLESVRESVEWLSQPHEADLIFLDIQLPDGLGFDIFEKIEVDTPVIFTTSDDGHAIRAFKKANSIDYLLKPLENSSLEDALRKLERIRNRINTLATPAPESPKPEPKRRFVIKTGDRFRYVSIPDVAYFYAEDNLVYLMAKDNKRFVINYTLDQLEQQLDHGHFFRLSRSHLASIDSIAEVSKYFNSRLRIALNPKATEEILVSRVKAPEFLRWMDQ